MAVIYYVADALTGNIVPGLTLPLTGVSMTHSFAGDVTFTGTHRMNDGLDQVNQDSWDYFQEVLRATAPGAACIVAIRDGTITAGEWLLWTSAPDDVTGIRAVGGIEWHRYLKHRPLEKAYVNPSIEAGTLVKTLLTDGFKMGQPLQLTIPDPYFGVNVGIDQQRKTAYYGDILDDYAKQVPFEWYVNSQCEFVDGVPVRVKRNIEIVKDRFLRPQPTELNLPTPGSPGGQFESFKRSSNYGDAAMAVTAFGKGQGDKQIVADQYTLGLQDGRHVITAKFSTHSDVESQADLQRIANAEASAAEFPEDPVKATIFLDTTPSYPSLGDVFPVRVHPRPSLPGSLIGTYRVGQTTVRPDDALSRMEVLMERIT